MSILKVILYSPINNQRIIYKDTNGVMTTDIEDAYFHRCHVRNFMPGGCRIEVCQKTRDALNTLVKKYDKATGSHIRKLSDFISKLPDGNCFYYFNEEKTSVVAHKTAILCIKAIRQGMSWNALLSQQFFNIASKGMFSWVVLTDCYISNKYGQSVQSFFCAPITELCRVMSSFSAACSVSDTLTRFAKS